MVRKSIARLKDYLLGAWNFSGFRIDNNTYSYESMLARTPLAHNETHRKNLNFRAPNDHIDALSDIIACPNALLPASSPLVSACVFPTASSGLARDYLEISLLRAQPFGNKFGGIL